jgi:CubicO group peptidase (beta-lactamase class C family)
MNRLTLLAMTLLWAGLASVAAATSADTRARTLDATDVNAWLDGIVPYGLQSGDIPGGVVVVVKDGEVLTERGFGYADIATRKPVDPESTLFRAGSVSKVFTWTAVMQQVEAGKIDLDADINQYLDFRIPERDGRPITMRHLMTHTAGFEEVLKNLYAADSKRVLTLGAFLKAWTPHRVHPAGEQSAYSNYGATLAGYIVERVSGESFSAYVARHIFAPLGMAHSTFEQPLPTSLAQHMSKGYPDSSRQPKGFELINVAPAGSLSASGDDMARFMIAHLMNGTYRGAQILQPETARLMHKEAFVQTPPLPGVALGFYHEDRNGHTIIGHAGDTELFHSDLHLFLDDKLGLFVSFNSAGKDGAVALLRSLIFRQFTDRYFPAPAREPLPTWPDAKADGARMVGAYILNRRSHSNFLRVLSGLSRVNVAMDVNGIITVSALKTPGGALRRWRKVGHLYWEEVDGDSHLAPRFVNGQYVGFTSDVRPPVMLFEPAPPWANLTPLWACFAYLAVFVLVWPISAAVRTRYGQRLPVTGIAAKAYRLIRLGALADLIVLFGWLALLAIMISGDIAEQNDAVNPWLRLLELCGLVTIVSAVIGAWNVTVVWRDQSRSWLAKLHSLLVLLALLGVAMEMFALNLIGWSVEF